MFTLSASLLITTLLAAGPGVEEVLSINQPNGWRLELRTDGSATLRFAAEPGAGFTCPAGTFDSEQVRKTLLGLPSATKDESRRRAHYLYWFEAERKLAPEKQPPSHFTQDEALLVPLFEKAASASLAIETPRGKQLLAEKSFRLPLEATRHRLYVVRTPSGWMLDIRNDGSAQLVFGDGGGGDSGTAPAGTFRPDEVRRTLDALKLDPQGSGAAHYVVWYEAERKSPSDGPPARYTLDEAALVPLFEKAAAARSETSGNRTGDVLGRKRPPFGLAK